MLLLEERGERGGTDLASGSVGSEELVHFKLCSSWYRNRRKAAEFLRNETPLPDLTKLWDSPKRHDLPKTRMRPETPSRWACDTLLP